MDNNCEIEKNAKFWFSKRFFVAILMFFGTIHAGAMEANLNIAIVDMTSIKRIQIQNETIVEHFKEAEFDWDSKTKGLILSAMGFGFFSSLFGSSLPIRIGGSTMTGVLLACSATLTIITPQIIRFNFNLYLLIRILEGLCEGLAHLSMTEVWSKWAPIQDRSKLVSIGLSGWNVGAAVIYPICGYAIHIFGWPAAFYATGISSMIWSVVWLMCITNDPESDKRISRRELAYIKENQINKKRLKKVLPMLKNVFTSKCVWALGLGNFAYGMGINFIMKCFPMYLKDITNVEIHQLGMLSAVPHILCFVTVPLAGCAIDYLQTTKILTPTQTHKTFMCTGYTVGAALLFYISLFHPEFVVAMLCFVLFKIILCLNFVIKHLGCICLAPQCPSIVAGFVMALSSFGGTVGPLLVGFVVTDHSLDQWNLCISITAIVLLIFAFLYLIWGSAEPQPWSYSTEDVENYDKPDKNESSRF